MQFDWNICNVIEFNVNARLHLTNTTKLIVIHTHIFESITICLFEMLNGFEFSICIAFRFFFSFSLVLILVIIITTHAHTHKSYYGSYQNVKHCTVLEYYFVYGCCCFPFFSLSSENFWFYFFFLKHIWLLFIDKLKMHAIIHFIVHNKRWEFTILLIISISSQVHFRYLESRIQEKKMSMNCIKFTLWFDVYQTALINALSCI